MPKLELHFILINPPSTTNCLCTEWRRAIDEILPAELRTHFTVLEGTLSRLPTVALECDCVVSPANSFGIMDGGCAPFIRQLSAPDVDKTDWCTQTDTTWRS